MALKYDYRNIDTSSWSEEDHQMAHNFCWTLLSVEIQNVTEKNWEEILFRILFLQRIGQGPWTVDQEPKVIIGWLKKFIGFGTNVGEKSRAKWLSHRAKYLAESIERETTVEINQHG